MNKFWSIIILLLLISCAKNKESRNEQSQRSYDTLRFGPFYGTKFSDVVSFQLQTSNGDPLTSFYDGSDYTARIDAGELSKFRSKLVSRNKNISVKENSLNRYQLSINKIEDGENNYDAQFALLNTYDTSGYIIIRRDSADNELGYTEYQPFARLDTIVRFMMKIKPNLDTLNCTYKGKPKTLGIGLITLAKDSFAIYNDSDLKSLFWAENAYKVSNNNEKCCANFHKPDYGIMNFICLDQSDNNYKILVNDSVTKYMYKNDLVSFKTWEDYIKSAMGLRRSLHDVSIKPEDNPFRTEPNDNAEIVDLVNEFESMCGLEVKGEWLKVRLDCSEFCEDEVDCENSLEAWIKWRNGEELIIDIALLS